MQKPDNDAGHENYSEGLVNEVLSLFPHVHQNAASGGHAIGRELHNKGDGLTAEDKAVQKRACEHGDDDAQKVNGKHDQRSRVGKEGANENAINGKLGAAAHEGREHDGHFAVPLTGQGSGGHDGRNATAKADNEGDKGGAGKTNLAQELVHHKGHAGHVTTVLQKRKEEEQGDNGGNEGGDTKSYSRSIK